MLTVDGTNTAIKPEFLGNCFSVLYQAQYYEQCVLAMISHWLAIC